MATITRTSYLTNIKRTLQLDQYDQDDFERRHLAYKRGDVTIDEAFPDISKEAKLFIIDGTTDQEWNDYDNSKGNIKDIMLRYHNT